MLHLQQLNNMGVSLLAQGHAVQAVQVLGGVTRLLQQGGNNEAQLEQAAEHAAVMYQAAQHLPRQYCPIRVETVDDCDENAKYQVALYGASHHQEDAVAFPLCLARQSSEQEEASIAYVTAVVLYNVALASHCAASHQRAAQTLHACLHFAQRSAPHEVGTSSSTSSSSSNDNNTETCWDLLLSLARQALPAVRRAATLQAHEAATTKNRQHQKQHAARAPAADANHKGATTGGPQRRRVQSFAAAA